MNEVLVKPLMEKVDILSTDLREHRSEFRAHVVDEAERDKKYITKEEIELAGFIKKSDIVKWKNHAILAGVAALITFILGVF